jgi:hypothetical protein
MSTAPAPPMPPPLSCAQVSAFLEQGYLGVAECMAPPAELARMVTSYDSLFQGHLDGAATGHPGLVQAPVSNAPVKWVFGPTLWTRLRSCALQLLRAARSAEGLCEDSGADFGKRSECGAIVKPSASGMRTELHQDEAYYDPHYNWSYSRVMVWVPLVDVTPYSGCMHFVPGSHRLPEGVLRHRAAPHQTLNPVTGVRFDELQLDDSGEGHCGWSDAVPLPLCAGGAAFWLPRTLHGSAANRSQARRRSIFSFCMKSTRK